MRAKIKHLLYHFHMYPLFKNVKVIAWDMDTTLYKPDPVLGKAFLDGCIEEVAKKKNLSFKDAKIIFDKARLETDSSTQTLINLKVGDFYTVWEIQKRIGKKNYLKKDPQLPLLFSHLSHLRHFLISNSVPEEIETVLGAIDLSEDYFEKCISVVDAGEPKPSPKPFELLLKITGLPPEQHVYIGDRELVDIVPAKKLGMKTILVWGKSKIADLSLPTVYDVAEIFRA